MAKQSLLATEGADSIANAALSPTKETKMSDRDMHPVFERLRGFVNKLKQKHTADRPIRKDGLIESSNDSPNTGPPPNEECSVCGCTRCDWHKRELAALRQQLAESKTRQQQLLEETQEYARMRNRAMNAIAMLQDAIDAHVEGKEAITGDDFDTSRLNADLAATQRLQAELNKLTLIITERNCD